MIKYLLILLLGFACPVKAQLSLVDSIVQKKDLQQTVYFLSQDSLKGRFTGSEGMNLAAQFIAARFDSLGLQSLFKEDEFFDQYVTDYEGRQFKAKNVVAVIPAKVITDTVVIFSAHYDHVGQKDDMNAHKDYTAADDIFNGANDNATGVAAMLALANYYKTIATNRYHLIFAAFSGEELGMLGSAHFLQRIKPGLVKAVINLEMLGRPDREKCFVVSLRNNNLKNILNRSLKADRTADTKNFFISDPYPDEELARRSDHYPFALKIKNAFTLMATSPQDIYYHSVDDEYETIDFDFMVRAVKNIALACEGFTR